MADFRVGVGKVQNKLGQSCAASKGVQKNDGDLLTGWRSQLEEASIHQMWNSLGVEIMTVMDHSPLNKVGIPWPIWI